MTTLGASGLTTGRRVKEVSVAHAQTDKIEIEGMHRILELVTAWKPDTENSEFSAELLIRYHAQISVVTLRTLEEGYELSVRAGERTAASPQPVNSSIGDAILTAILAVMDAIDQGRFSNPTENLN